MSVATSMLTVAEFAEIRQPAGGVRQELHHGVVFEMPPVKLEHSRIQRRLVKLLESGLRSGEFGVDKEVPFRPLAEYEVWIADVAVFREEDWSAPSGSDYFQGVPNIVIEVLSPSNTASEMLDREATCLKNGGEEFWLVDPRRQTVRTVDQHGKSRVLSAEDTLESTLLTRPIPVRAIFTA